MKKLMIIDDYPPLLECLTVILEDHFEVICLSSPFEALEILCEVKPDILLVDNKMPEVTGIEFLEKICNLSFPVRKIIYSTSLSYDELNQAELLGVEAYIEKPFSIDQLKSVLGLE